MGNETSAGNKCTESGHVMDMLEYLEAHIASGKSAGVDFSEVEDMLSGARIMIESRELEDAAELINQCMEAAGKRFSEHERLVVGIRRAEREIKAAHDAGGDVSEASKLLKLARTHMERGDYVLGIGAAKEAVEVLARKKPAEIVWGSALAES